MEEQCTMAQFAITTERVRVSVLELERAKNNYKYHSETYTDSMLVVKEQYQKLKLFSDNSDSERDDQIMQMEQLTKLLSAYRLHTHDHNLALFRLRHSTSALTKVLQTAKTFLTENSPLNQSQEELELRSLIRKAETIYFRY